MKIASKIRSGLLIQARFFNVVAGDSKKLSLGLFIPIKCGKDTAGNVSLLSSRLGGDVMSKAQAQKHRAVSLDTDENTQPPGQDSSGGFPYMKGNDVKIYICILITVLALSGCANPRSTTNQLELGMTKDQVRAIMGEPDSSAAIKGQGDCYFYSMWRDFWNRRPGDYSDRYYACFKSGELVVYGRVGDPM